MGQQRAGQEFMLLKADGALDLEKVRVGDGAFRQACSPAVSLAVLLLLPLKFVVPNFSCTLESPS